MRPLPFIALAAALAAGCRSSAPAPVAEPVPTASAAASASAASAASEGAAAALPSATPPAAPDAAVDEDGAIAAVLALPEVKALPGPKGKAVAWVFDRKDKPCATFPDGICPFAGQIEILAGVEEDGERSPSYRFFVWLATGAIEVDAGFQLHSSPDPQRLPYAAWSRLQKRRMRAVGIARNLPEVAAWARWIRRQSTPAQPLDMSFWTERFPDPDCNPADPDCSFIFYVGENHIGSHSVRWNSFRVSPEAHRIGVIPYSAIETPYDTWRDETPLKGDKDFQRLLGPFPDRVQGRGDLGYGAPQKVVDDVTRWGHPAKKELSEQGLRVTRVELYLDNSYPVFFVAPSPGVAPLHERAAKSPWDVRLAAHAILEANGGFAFELVEDAAGGRSRYRYRGKDRTFERLLGDAWRPL
jgi:hypothetical protein